MKQRIALRDAILNRSAIAVAQRPISFNRQMVQALIDGRKSQTRRLIRPAPSRATTRAAMDSRCPFGKPGDLLWVRERWQMRKADRRIRLLIRSVRAERLQQITQEDARAEGFDGAGDPVDWFSRLWDSIVSDPGQRWRDNPWVWVIEFDVQPPKT